MQGLYITDKAKVAAAVVREKNIKKSAALLLLVSQKKTTFPLLILRESIEGPFPMTRKKNFNSLEGCIEDISCHGGDCDSPYESEWAHSSHSSTQATPVFQFWGLNFNLLKILFS